MRRSAAVLAFALALGSCSADGPSGPVAGPGAETPAAAVEALVAAMQQPDFDAAAALAMPRQAALAALAEGASFGDVAEALRDEDAQVTANFWAGFAQGAGEYLTGELQVAADGSVAQGGVTFHRVDVTLPDGTARRIYTRDADGHRIDLFASFGGAIAGRMIQPAERLLASQTEDARFILGELREIVPSLMVAASNEELQASVRADILSLVEVITRYG
ncbi:MAG: hypothetical protein DIU67_004440 [Actinomycetes bacterium]|jgi:hypothetical protein